MVAFSPSEARIAVIGLGYVGLPLALALARHFPVKGFDADAARRADLQAGLDCTGEVSTEILQASTLELAAGAESLSSCNVFIVTVPTPIDDRNTPDLSFLKAAASAVGGVMSAGAVVVFESTVYPGVTEDVCGPELAAASELTCGVDFFLGYSPERINPGDTVHTVENITKVVAGQTPQTATLLADIYSAVVPAGIHVAADIRTAEAAKAIENAQRDINIAFINEVTMIFQRMGINTHDVLAAARTKWNFLDFKPGLVGGHCIGVDPFYLAHAAKAVGHEPEVILAGRRINDSMAEFVAEEVSNRLGKPSKILVLGLTFKENVADLRNSKVFDMIAALQQKGHEIDVVDPVAAAYDAKATYGIQLSAHLPAGTYDAAIGAVAHDAFKAYSTEQLTDLLGHEGLLVDLKDIWSDLTFASRIRRWLL